MQSRIIKDSIKIKTDNKLEKYILQYLFETYSTIEEIRTFASDLSQHGCVSGLVPLLIYYKDTGKFYSQFKEEIWDMLYEDAREQGIEILELIRNLNIDSWESSQQFENNLAWYGFERGVERVIENI